MFYRGWMLNFSMYLTFIFGKNSWKFVGTTLHTEQSCRYKANISFKVLALQNLSKTSDARA